MTSNEALAPGVLATGLCSALRCPPSGASLHLAARRSDRKDKGALGLWREGPGHALGYMGQVGGWGLWSHTTFQAKRKLARHAKRGCT